MARVLISRPIQAVSQWELERVIDVPTTREKYMKEEAKGCTNRAGVSLKSRVCLGPDGRLC